MSTKCKKSTECFLMIYALEKYQSYIKSCYFGPGYQGQENLIGNDIKYNNENCTYLAKYFTERNYAFISIQRDIAGDEDGLETVDPNASSQHDARKHLYKRGVGNISFVIGQLRSEYPNLELDKFILSGHSNDGVENMDFFLRK